MEEEQKIEESDNSGEGDKPTSDDPIERADTAVKRLEEENARLEANLKELKEIKARDIIGGKSETGTPDPKEETPAEYAKRIMNNGS